MILRRITETTTLLLISIAGLSQLPPPSTGVSPSGVLDGVYVQEHIPTKRVIQYTHLREADVMWSKRVWRTIDLREKMNYQLYYPLTPITDRMSLYDVIRYGALKESTLTLYELSFEMDDQFKYPVVKTEEETLEQFEIRKLSFFGEEVSVPVFDEEGEPAFDEDGNPMYEDKVTEYTSADIIAYELKEDWFFDKQRSVLDVRIIGISPVVYQMQDGKVAATKNLFWLYFPECRYVFQNFFVYNEKNDAARMSFDDLFWKRDFSSFIHKESNIFDRGIQQTWKGIETLLESERIKGEMFRLEHDLWNL